MKSCCGVKGSTLNCSACRRRGIGKNLNGSVQAVQNVQAVQAGGAVKNSYRARQYQARGRANSIPGWNNPASDGGKKAAEDKRAMSVFIATLEKSLSEAEALLSVKRHQLKECVNRVSVLQSELEQAVR